MAGYQLKLSCKYYELSTENIQNENVHCQVIKQDVFKGVCEYEVCIMYVSKIMIT